MSEKIINLVKDLTLKIGVNDAVVSVEDKDGSFRISIETRDEFSLVGRENEKYEAFSHLLKRMLAKMFGEESRFFIDVNGALARAENQLVSKAKMIAERAKNFKVDVEMEGLSSYERRIVHAALDGIPGIKTESRGEGKGRKLVVRFVPQGESADFDILDTKI
ncbi:MAG: spoIIIJ-associated protein [Patescibacteria group bacterium]|jgi:spoIIIJ-associated protein|nr:spoIIIJ-associated protein [Patescibacteria group bacterium]